MKAIRLRQPASLENLYLDQFTSHNPAAGEIQVRIRAASLNFRDGLVVNGFFPVRNGLIPLSDGAGFDLDTIPFAIVQAKRLRLQGVTVGTRKDQSSMVRAIEANAIKPVIDRSFQLEQLPEAFHALRSGDLFGKIVIEI